MWWKIKNKMAGEVTTRRRKDRNCFTGRKSLIFFSFAIFVMLYIITCVYHFKTVTNFEVEEFMTIVDSNMNKPSFSLPTFKTVYAVLISLKSKFFAKFSHNTEISQTPVSGLVRKSQDTGIFLHNDKGQLLCGTSTLKVLILIVSDHKELDLRMSIRQTWANKAAMTAKYIKHGGLAAEFKWRKLFVISRGDDDWAGAQFVRTELLMQPDILEVEIQEHPTKRALKLYSALRWALNNCNFQYLMYTTAQNFVNLPALYNFLHRAALMERKDLYAGNLFWESVLLPNLTRHEEKEFLPKTKLQYIKGESSILSRPSLETVINDLAYLSTFFVSIKPDIMVAGAMYHNMITPRNIKNFIKRLDCPENCCENSKQFIQMHETKAKCFRNFYRNYNWLLVFILVCIF